ncbi:putative MFS family arabinose efflux permease [Silvibacterium bohemicum]|uniref:Putative MFS family arabinose efflux permease n=1 Tax=Silvibacterium bohemicum TaxID=1577686 RepID=A0A841JRY1_9BACT|nr:MFS transporter [Silvibacterium bohemicum]MBB6143165.1 putative MFS family arabinose efflux permease [Silvibacterium bohemicum]
MNDLETISPEVLVDAPPRHHGLLPFLGLACGVGVSNIYYNQPLLLDMARSLHVDHSRMGTVAVATQIGYSIGILAFVPLGDVIERRGLMVRLMAGVAVAALLAAFAPNLAVLLAASIAIGLTAAVTHIIVPIAPELADDEERGRAIGTVMTGLLLGVLLARSVSGWIASFFGWRAVFFFAAASNAAFVPLLLRKLPKLPPHKPVRYMQALRSLWTLIRTQPLLRESAVLGGLVFAAFSAFWTTLVFLLGSKHYHLGAGTAGSFGVLGATGALIAPIAGRIADRRGSRTVVTLGLSLLTLGFCTLWLLGYHIMGLVLGVIVLDLGTQATQIANQTRIFGLEPGARGRINTIYMMIYFLGGSLGSLFSTIAWAHWGWSGVCALGLGLLGLAALRHATGVRDATA